MVNRPAYPPRPALLLLADQILALELLWPLPLIMVGVLRVLSPLPVSTALVLALIPRLTRWLVLGRPTCRSFIGGPLVLLGVSALIGGWGSYDPTLSWPLCLTLLGGVALFFAIVNTSVSSPQVAGGVVVTAALFAFYFVGQYGHFNYPYPEKIEYLTHLGRATGSWLPNLVFFIPHLNAAAGFLEGAFLLSLGLTWQTPGLRRAGWGLAAMLIAYGLLISKSRGAWLGVGIALVIEGLWLIPRPGLRLAAAGVGLGLAGLAAYLTLPLVFTGASVPVVSSLLQAATGRLALYRNCFYLWSDYPFTGIGPGDTFALVYSHYQLLIPYPFLTYSHNLFLAVGLGLGLLGLIAMGWLLISFYAWVIRVERTAPLPRRHLSLFRAAWLGVTITLIHGLTDAPQFAGFGWPMPMWFALLGVTIAGGRALLVEANVYPHQEMAGVLSQRARAALAAVGMAVLVVTMVIFWRPLLSAWYANLGALQQTRAELRPDLDAQARERGAKQAAANFAYALTLNPEQVTAHWRLGLMDLQQENFDLAVAHLEPAYRQEPGNQAILKALGLAYLWAGRLDRAASLLRQRDDRAEVIEELGNWSSWWGTQDRTDLSEAAAQVARRLRE